MKPFVENFKGLFGEETLAVRKMMGDDIGIMSHSGSDDATSIILPKQQALNMAKWIIENVGE